MSTKMAINPKSVYVLNLELDCDKQSVLYRCNNRDSIQFIYGSTLLGRHISLFSNYSQESVRFDRNKYHELVFRDEVTTITFETSGSFHFYYKESAGDVICGQFYIVVSPQLKVGSDATARLLDLNAIQCQTVLTKSLGQFETWKSKLEVAYKTGYNMVHFTPIQELGGSNSSYCLSDQLKLNPIFSSKDKEYTFDDISEFTEWMRKEWQILSLTDIVLNHTANESPWLQTHPECAYNCLNSPWLRPAYLLDRILYHLTCDIIDNKWQTRGLTTEVNTEHHLNLIKTILHEEYLPIVMIFEFDDQWTESSIESIRHKLTVLNENMRNEVNHHLSDGIENAIKSMRYERIDEWGPKHKLVSLKQPLVCQYFTHKGPDLDLVDEQALVFDDNTSQFLMAHNGWVMNDDPLRNFAEKGSNIYIRRELIAWGDSVKLRYGSTPNECPYLWSHMEKYVIQMATIFHGIRLDNCHSTPIHVASHLIDCARRVNPNLYLIAELFTAHEKRLSRGSSEYLVLPLRPTVSHAIFFDITHDNESLIVRHSAYDPLPSAALISMTYSAIGSNRGFDELVNHHINVVTETREYKAWDPNNISEGVSMDSGIIKSKRELNKLHEWLAINGYSHQFVDQRDTDTVAVTRHNPQTHESVVLVARTAFQKPSDPKASPYLPPLRIDGLIDKILFETRMTGEPEDDFIRDKLLINGLQEFRSELRTNISVDESQMIKANRIGDSYEIIFSQFPASSVIAFKVSFSSYHMNAVQQTHQLIKQLDDNNSDINTIISNLSLNDLNFVLFRCNHEEVDDINGGAYGLSVAVTRHNPQTHESVVLVARTAFQKPSDPKASPYLPPLRIDGLIDKILFETRMTGEPEDDFIKDKLLINGLQEFRSELRTNISVDESQMIKANRIGDSYEIMFTQFPASSVIAFKVSFSSYHMNAVQQTHQLIKQLDDNNSDINTIISNLSLNDLNFVLFRCNHEEVDDINGGAYGLPNMGQMNYCGIASVIYYLRHIRTNNDLGHPLCGNLRDGNWLMDYIGNRLKKNPNTIALSEWLSKAFTTLSQIPRYLIPRYFDSIITPIYTLILDQIWNQSSPFVRKGPRFVQLLALGGLALVGTNKTAVLPPLSPKLVDELLLLPTLAAGLDNLPPSLRAILRRDAVWWWLQAIKDYCLLVPNGVQLLSEPVRRLYPTDDSPALLSADNIVEEPLSKTIQEALQRHFDGIDFIEKNAGKQIDEHMTEEGFHIRVGVSRDTGFVFGGNAHNCGTWMDKMGSSAKAGNKGRPSTPRDGSAVELIGLSKSVATFLADLSDKNQYPFKGVKESDGKEFTFREWGLKIKDNFEKYFHISDDSNDELINRRLI
ncbi:unnamed protein product, partial [Oppiella nova]